MSPAVLWSLVGVGSAAVAVGGFFLFRFLAQRAFDGKVRNLFETGQHHMAAELLIAKGRPAEAAENLLKWGKRDRAAQIYVQIDEPVQAAEIYEKDRQYGTAAVYYLKAGEEEKAARCYARHGRADKAAELYERVGRVDRAAELLRDAGDFGKLTALMRSSGNQAGLVEALVEAGDLEQAAQCLREVGDDARADELLLQHYEGQHMWSEAAAIYAAQGRTDEAVDRHRKAGEFEQAGDMLLELGRTEDALQQFQQARVFDKAAQCFETLGKRREAANHYLLAGLMKQAVDNLILAGDVVSVGQLYEQHGFTAQALDVLNIEQAHPQYKHAHILRARYMEKSGDVEGARNELIAVVTRLGLSQSTLDVVFLIAELYAQQGDADNALRILERTRDRGLRHPRLEQRISALRSARERTRTASVAAPEINLQAALPQSDRYEFQQKLGQGGMGAVYKAHDRQLDREVAIKLLLDSDLPSDMARKYFLREAETVSVLNHPNIVGLYDVGEMDGRLYISMEFIDGRNLEQIVKKAPILPLDLLLPISIQLSEALDYAHSQKVVHRDIKLGNVMVTRDERVKLMDFGLAKAITENPDRSLLVIGTPYYMAPEQIAHEECDHRVDIYALGILLYRLTTGHLPFETGDVLRAQRFDAPPDPLTHNPDIPHALVGLILHCLEKDPDDRPERAMEVADVLRTLL